MFCNKLRPQLRELEKDNLWDSFNNTKLCRTLAYAGGDNNLEYSFNMFDMLNRVDKECNKLLHLGLGNKSKCARLSALDLGWSDILDKAERKYISQITGNPVRWPPACNARDSKGVPPAFPAKNPNKPRVSKKKNPKCVPPKAGESEVKTFHGEYFYWCAKCKRWTKSHGTAGHTGGKSNPACAPSGGFDANRYLIPEPHLW